MEGKNLLTQISQTINKGAKVPAIKLVKEDPATASVISKLVKGPLDQNEGIRDRSKKGLLNLNRLTEISDSIQSKAIDGENTIQLFPDLEMAIQILVSSILSPKDMTETSLIFKTKDLDLPSDILSKFIDIVKSDLEGHYAITEYLQDILRASLFESGSYVRAVMPESMVDEIINNTKRISQESMSELFDEHQKTTSLGLLGNPGTKPKFSLEALYGNETNPSNQEHPSFELGNKTIVLENISVTDNYKLLKLPLVLEAAKANRRRTIINQTSMESHGSTLHHLLYKDAPREYEDVLIPPSVINLKRKSVTRPLVMRLPSEAVIPVYVPSDPSHHIGYFVLLDDEGHPITKDANNKYLCNVANMSAFGGSPNTDLSSHLLNKAKSNLRGSDGEPTIEAISQIYTEILLSDFEERMANGLVGNGYEIANLNEFSRVLLARSLSSRNTRIIFLPLELTTYFAFKYFNNGVGKSLMEDLRQLTSMRAIILFSKVMAMSKSAINNTHVKVQMEPDDVDPDATIEAIEQLVTNARQNLFPLGVNNPADLVDWIGRAGLSFSYENHPDLPRFEIDYDVRQLQQTIPDSELEETLRKQTYMALGISPEVIDNSFDPEFATTVISNNILFSKRVSQLQDIFTSLLTDHIRKIVRYDVNILGELHEVIAENLPSLEKALSDEEKELYLTNKEIFLNDVIERFVESLVIDLPRPNITTLENQLNAFEKYKQSLEATIEYWISSNVLSSDLVGEYADNADSLKDVLMGYFLRKWCSENNFMSELNDIITKDEDGNPSLDIYEVTKDHTTALLQNGLNFINNLNAAKLAANKDMENLEVEPGESGGFDSGGGDDSGGGGEEDDPFDMDFGGDEEGGAEGEDGPPDPDQDLGDDLDEMERG